MIQKKPAEPMLLQRYIEKGLFIAACILGTMHMLLVVFRYTINASDYWAYEQWFGLALIVAVIAYAVFSWFRFPKTRYRFKAFFAGMKSYEYLFVTGLFIWILIVCLLRQGTDHQRYFLYDWWLFDMAVMTLIFFPLARYAGKDKARKAIEWMLHIVVLSYTVFVGWSLWQILHLNFAMLPSGNQIGMTSKLELILGCHYNITGAHSLTMFVVACYMIATQKKALKVVYAIAALLQLYTQLLSNSRTVYVCALFIGASVSFCTVWYMFRNKKMNIRLISSIGAAAAGALIIWLLRKATFWSFDAITGFTAQLASGKIKEGTEAIRELTSLQGRDKIWLSALKVMISSPLEFFFGVTPFGVTKALKEIGGLHYEAAHAHNEVLQVGTTLGVPAMCAFIVFLVRIGIRCVRSVFDTNRADYMAAAMTAVVIGSMIVLTLTEAYLVAYWSIMSCVFFLMCGLMTETVPWKKGDSADLTPKAEQPDA